VPPMPGIPENPRSGLEDDDRKQGQIVFGRGNLDKVRRMLAESVDPLFSLPPVEQLLAGAHFKVDPSRPCVKLRTWMRKISMKFVTHPDLEAQFEQDYYNKFHVTNRKWILGLSIVFLLLGIYDHLAYAPESSSGLILRTWILRCISVLIGLFTVLISYLRPREYSRWMQVMSTFTLTIMGIVMVQIGIDFHFYNSAYGVGLVLVLTSLFSLLVGMRCQVRGVVDFAGPTLLRHLTRDRRRLPPLCRWVHSARQSILH